MYTPPSNVTCNSLVISSYILFSLDRKLASQGWLYSCCSAAAQCWPWFVSWRKQSVWKEFHGGRWKGYFHPSNRLRRGNSLYLLVFYPLGHCPDGHNKRGWTRQKSGVSSRSPTCCDNLLLPRICVSRKWDWKQEWDSIIDTLILHVSIPSSAPQCPAASPHFCLHLTDLDQC